MTSATDRPVINPGNSRDWRFYVPTEWDENPQEVNRSSSKWNFSSMQKNLLDMNLAC